MKSKDVIFIADFFRTDILGGAESNDFVLISRLESEGFKVEKVKSTAVSSEFILKNKDKNFIVSNFIGLSKDSKDNLVESGCKYVIYEHDHKYVSSRDPSIFANYDVPANKIVNKGFYESAFSVVVLSKICKEVIEKNLNLTNVHSIGCSLWTKEKFALLRDLAKNKKIDTVVLQSNNPTKGTSAAENVCKSKNIEYKLISSPDEKEFLTILSKAERLVFIPQVLETFCRLVAEAKMLGCKVLTKTSLLGFASEECFSLSGDELINEMSKRVDAAVGLFVKILKEETPLKILNEKISVVLLTWKREESTKQLVEQAFSNSIVDEVILWNNNIDIEYTRASLECLNKQLTIVNSADNKITFGRYIGAKLAKNRLIYVQDDDWSIKDIQIIYDNYNNKGSDILSVVPNTHIQDAPDKKFVGWGSLFDKKCLSVFDRYLDLFGEDFILHREADLLFTNTNKYDKFQTRPKQLVPDDTRSLSLEAGHHAYHYKMLERTGRLKNER